MRTLSDNPGPVSIIIEKYIIPALLISFAVCMIFISINSNRKAGIAAEKEKRESCSIEDTLSFEGVITEYNGLGHKTRPIVLIIDRTRIEIPRYNAEMSLYTGDTIKKIKGEHAYYLKRGFNSRNLTGRCCDTMRYDCR